ncbi:ABC transporter substrate-binding protein [Agromyces silvae]|uniref:ABC transporter substrate-binding protein n=1 Tax=Agromyces silvae TaxID=3388266 RepID=UPI00280AD0B7|nr:ABC transporter substrate-binding protein [Agromyces protaetiae]
MNSRPSRVRRRNIAASIAMTAAVALTVTACSADGSDTGADGVTTIKVLNWEPGGSEFWDATVAAFEAAHPDIKVELETVPFDRYPEVQGPYITSKTGPDVMANNAGLELFDRVSAYVELPDEVLAAGEDLLTYSGACLDFDTANPCYGLPFSYQGNVMYYNKQVLAEAGLDPEAPPTTWEEFGAACDAVSAAGKTCLALGLTGVFPAYWDFPEVAKNYLSEDDVRAVLKGELDWTDPKMVSVLEGLASITDAGWNNSNAPSITMLPDGADLFQSGQAAFAGTILSDAVNWQAFGEAIGPENLGAMLWPAIVPDAPRVKQFSGIEGSVYGVTTWSTKQEAAFEFVKWMAGAENGQLWAEIVNGQPLNTQVDTSAFPDSPALQQIQEIIADPTLHVGVMLSGQETDALARGWQQVALGQLTVDDWAAQMQTALENSPGKQ